jgi:hypothetical protein
MRVKSLSIGQPIELEDVAAAVVVTMAVQGVGRVPGVQAASDRLESVCTPIKSVHAIESLQGTTKTKPNAPMKGLTSSVSTPGGT